MIFPLPADFSCLTLLNDGAPLDVELRENGDEWIEFVFRRLGETVGSTGYSMAAHQALPGGYIYRVTGEEVLTALWVLFTRGGGPLCAILSQGEPAEADVEVWWDAVTHAVDQIGTVTTFAWWTIIGPDPHSGMGAAVRLAAAATAGGLRLDPEPGLFFENVPDKFNLFSGRPQHSGLVKATGESIGYTWHVATSDAARRVRLLCALLSISSGTAWIQRVGVHPLIRHTAAGAFEPTRPEDIELPAASPWEREDMILPADEVQVHEVEVPPWINARWETIVGDVRLTHALLNHHEGMLMMANHPSHACLAFVTTIEALGNRAIKKPPRCKHCRVVSGSGERFRQALARVIPADEAEQLGRRFYNWRSRTAHDGILHGLEPTFGAWPHSSGFSESTERAFQTELFGLAAAARRLLLLEVGGIAVPQSSLR
ncbi:hypothetical protein [Pseudosporangium ferrugineum]|uniref:Apea-like HEPN domain-containing protein n=1 Tax=Pseudosporangium ferrugineum TaxID=439699 RepID=A0A2T0RCG6_9ACTN|nr:hypothetical protein [Pseudosporangium ferrugineum]PRY18874.1 hypothetical protein CLV70_1424 [Pseudosporangium ferrugineum]